VLVTTEHLVRHPFRHHHRNRRHPRYHRRLQPRAFRHRRRPRRLRCLRPNHISMALTTSASQPLLGKRSDLTPPPASAWPDMHHPNARFGCHSEVKIARLEERNPNQLGNIGLLPFCWIAYRARPGSDLGSTRRDEPNAPELASGRWGKQAKAILRGTRLNPFFITSIFIRLL